jgi:hypothetical protein
MNSKRVVIELYPKTPKPDWLKVGVKCNCHGEARDVFIVNDIDDNSNSSMLETLDGCCHGRESWSKLHLEFIRK